MEARTNAEWFSMIEAGNTESILASVNRFKGFADANGETALMKAVRKRDAAIVKLLAPHEHSWANPEGYTALMLAALNDAEDLCKILLSYESAYTLADGTTALMLAAVNGSLNALEFLLPYLADCRDHQHQTALTRAVEAHQIKAVRLILRGWVHMIRADVDEALAAARRYDMSDLCQIIEPYIGSTPPVHSSTYSDPSPGKLARKTASTPSSAERLTSTSLSSTASVGITKPFRQKDPGVVELERKAAILDEVTGFINSQTKLSSLTATDITDYLTTVFSRNYILTAEKTQLQAELDKAQQIIQGQALDLKSSNSRGSSSVPGISIIGDANEVYTRTLSDTQAELSRCLIELEEKRSMMEIAKTEEDKLILYINSKLGTKASSIDDLKYVLGNFFDQSDALREENASLRTELRDLQGNPTEKPRHSLGSISRDTADMKSKLLAKETELEILRKSLSDMRAAHAGLITDHDILRTEVDHIKSKQTAFLSEIEGALSVPCKGYDDVLAAIRTADTSVRSALPSMLRDLEATKDDNKLLRLKVERLTSDQQLAAKYTAEFLATLSAYQKHPVLLSDANSVLAQLIASTTVPSAPLFHSTDGALPESSSLPSSSAAAQVSTKRQSLSTLLELSAVTEEQNKGVLDNKQDELESLRNLQACTAQRADRLEQELNDARKQLAELQDSIESHSRDLLLKARLYDEAASAVIDVTDAKAGVENVVVSHIFAVREENKRLRADLVLARERVSEKRLVDVLSTTDTTGQIDYLYREMTEYQRKLRTLTDSTNRIFDAIEGGLGQRYHNADEVVTGLTRHFARVRCLNEQLAFLKGQENQQNGKGSDPLGNHEPSQYKEVYITATDNDIRKRNEAIVKLTEENGNLRKELEKLRPYERFYNERKCEQCVINAETIQKLNTRLASADKNVAQLNHLVSEKEQEIQKLRGEIAEHIARQTELLASQSKICMTKTASKSDSTRPGSAFSGRSKRASSANVFVPARSSVAATRPMPTPLANIATMAAKAQAGGLRALIQANPGTDLSKYGTIPHEADQLLAAVGEVVNQLKQAKSDDRTLLKDWAKLSEKIATLLAKLFKATTDPQIVYKELEDCKHSRDALKQRLAKA
ncbi:Protein 21.1 [Giardia lamblia P15]|uniref:Protein 21.1 n=1 Tax=Giardia intestinalis (strain P15) TaxID=658858 RepID=E1F9F0_GIAIA|nr:Protein 21.1 [Giardia lamblia P15]